jgi:uncharacterized protein with HEPN domain
VKRDVAYLSHIRDATRRIQDYTRDGQEAFMASTLIQDAVIRNLEIIGEAAKALSPAFRKQHTNIPWSSMAGMRDVLIHGYMGVDLKIGGMSSTTASIRLWPRSSGCSVTQHMTNGADERPKLGETVSIKIEAGHPS